MPKEASSSWHGTGPVGDFMDFRAPMIFFPFAGVAASSYIKVQVVRDEDVALFRSPPTHRASFQRLFLIAANPQHILGC